MLAMFIRLKTCPFSLGRRLEFHIGRLDLLEKECAGQVAKNVIIFKAIYII